MDRVMSRSLSVGYFSTGCRGFVVIIDNTGVMVDDRTDPFWRHLAPMLVLPGFYCPGLPMLFNLNNDFENALRFSRFDDQHLLSTVSAHSFVLDEEAWATAEQCYQAQKFAHNPAYRERIVAAGSAQEAYKLGNRWWPLKRGDFKRVRRVLMTRACYCKAQQNPEVAAFLLGTGEEKLVESSLYDHYWGIGRDLRGLNMLGEVWMDVRKRLRERRAEAANGQK